MSPSAENPGHAPRVHQDKDAIRRMSIQHADIDNLVREAAAATEAEHNMGIWAALKLYPKAVGWSMLLSTAMSVIPDRQDLAKELPPQAQILIWLIVVSWKASTSFC